MDESGCVDTLAIEVAEPEALQVLLTEVVGSEMGQFEGSIAVEVSGGTGEYTFDWSQLEDGEFTSNDQNLIGLDPGTYQLLVQDSNGCSVNSFEITVEAIVGLHEIQGLELSAYPNPATNWVRLTWDISERWNMLLVHDLQGKLVHEMLLPMHSNGVQIAVNHWDARGLFRHRFRWSPSRTIAIVESELNILFVQLKKPAIYGWLFCFSLFQK